jgi:hypothetical protein
MTNPRNDTRETGFGVAPSPRTVPAALCESSTTKFLLLSRAVPGRRQPAARDPHFQLQKSLQVAHYLEDHVLLKNWASTSPILFPADIFTLKAKLLIGVELRQHGSGHALHYHSLSNLALTLRSIARSLQAREACMLSSWCFSLTVRLRRRRFPCIRSSSF